DPGRRRVGDRRIGDAHDALVDAAALLVAEREARAGARAAADAAGGLVHPCCVPGLAAATVTADTGRRRKRKACGQTDHYPPMAPCGSHRLPLKLLLQRLETGLLLRS